MTPNLSTFTRLLRPAVSLSAALFARRPAEPQPPKPAKLPRRYLNG